MFFKKENQDINFNNLPNNNPNQKSNRYFYNNYNIITEIIDNKLNIIIEEKNETNLNIKKYERLYTKEELIKINKIFSMFDKIEDSINILELNNNNCLITKGKNSCILSIKLETRELPKNKISDSIIFEIPLIVNENNDTISYHTENNDEDKMYDDIKSLNNEKNNEENKINDNKNLLNNEKDKMNNAIKSLNIEKNDIEIENNINNLKNNLNDKNIYSLVQNLIDKVNKLTEENKEIKNRISILEKNNNELINIIKENRIDLLKEINNSNSPSTNISNNKIFENKKNNFDFNDFFLIDNNQNINDLESENSINYLTRIHNKYLNEKIKNKNRNDINEKDLKSSKMALEINKEKNKLNNNYIEKKNIFDDDINIKDKKEDEDDDEDNYLFSNKAESEEIYDDLNLFKGSWSQKKFETNKPYEQKNDINHNIIPIDENEENYKEKYNNDKNSKDEFWSANKRNNYFGNAYPPNYHSASFFSNNNYIKNKNNIFP